MLLLSVYNNITIIIVYVIIMIILPWQNNLSTRLYPSWQEHENEPMLLWHSWEHPPFPVKHSLISSMK